MLSLICLSFLSTFISDISFLFFLFWWLSSTFILCFILISLFQQNHSSKCFISIKSHPDLFSLFLKLSFFIVSFSLFFFFLVLFFLVILTLLFILTCSSFFLVISFHFIIFFSSNFLIFHFFFSSIHLRIIVYYKVMGMQSLKLYTMPKEASCLLYFHSPLILK